MFIFTVAAIGIAFVLVLLVLWCASATKAASLNQNTKRFQEASQWVVGTTRPWDSK
jgi:hypothetical protein